MRINIAPVLTVLGAAIAQSATALPIPLHQGTGTYSQTCCSRPGAPFSPAQAIDGIFTVSGPEESNGWTIAHFDAFGGTDSETAAWETGPNVSADRVTFKMYFFEKNPGHLLGRFRLSVTTDDRSTFADGQDTGGDVTANWTVLTGPTVAGPAGMTFTTLSDDSILAGGTVSGTGTYEVIYMTNISGITGVRLEAIEDLSLPGGNGPGMFARNGNFVLTEIEMFANDATVPEPATLALLALGLAGLGWSRRKHA